MSALASFGFHQFVAERISQSRDDLILELEQIRQIILEAIGPEMRAGLTVNKLRVDAHSVAVPLYRAFEDIAHAQFLADLFRCSCP